MNDCYFECAAHLELLKQNGVVMKNLQIDKIRISQFVLVERCTGAFGRLILSLVKADEILDCRTNTNYDAIFKKGSKQFACKLVYSKVLDEWYLESETNADVRYKIVECTDTIAKVLKVNDVITYKIDNKFIKFKILKYFEEHKRFIVWDTSLPKEDKQARHNLSTILKNYSDDNIVSITTYDETINKNIIN